MYILAIHVLQSMLTHAHTHTHTHTHAQKHTHTLRQLEQSDLDNVKIMNSTLVQLFPCVRTPTDEPLSRTHQAPDNYESIGASKTHGKR